ncbi:unnamed protein product [Lepidochelys kempii]
MRTTDCPPTISLPTAYWCLFRNPQDTAASFFHFLKNISDIPCYNSWDEFFSEFMSGKVNWGSYFDHVVAQSKHIEDENVMIITYEDLKENLLPEANPREDDVRDHLRHYIHQLKKCGKLQVTMQSSSAEVTMMESQNRKRAPAWTEREVWDLIAVWG